MNRKIKNGILIGIMLIACVCSYFTMKGATKGSVPNNDSFRKEQGDRLGRPSKDFESGFDLNELPENFDVENIPNKDNLSEEFKNGQFAKGDFKSNIKVIYYVLFVVEALIISLTFMYLIMSNFNNKTLKEAIGTSKKIIIFILLVLVLTAALTIVQSILAKNVFVNKDMPQFKNNMPINRENNSVNVENSNESNSNTFNNI